MDIRQATIAAIEIRGGIARKAWIGAAVAIPRDDPRGLHLISKDHEPAAGWQPREDDLIANDWLVIAPVSDLSYQRLEKIEDCFQWAGKALLHLNNSEIGEDYGIGNTVRKKARK